MEPIAASGSGAVFRPLGTASPELTTLLRAGRVLAAEVLGHPADGTVLLAIGRYSVPAQSQLRLDPGTRFSVRVVAAGDGVVLEILGDAGREESSLIQALRGVVGEERPLGELLTDVARLLAESEPEDLTPALRELARALPAFAAGATLGAAALRALLEAAGLGHEARLAGLLGGRAALEDVERLRSDLKALLLRAHQELESGGREAEPVRSALARALAGLEAEQLLNLARERAGEPLVLSLPVLDGDGFATARLLVPGRKRDGDGERSAEENAAFRLTLGVELSSLGPVRADLYLAPDSLSVRILVAREALARRIERDLGALASALSDGRRALRIDVRVGSPAEATLDQGLLDIRYLHENPLLNLAG